MRDTRVRHDDPLWIAVDHRIPANVDVRVLDIVEDVLAAGEVKKQPRHALRADGARGVSVLQKPQYIIRGRVFALATRSATAATRLRISATMASAFGVISKIFPSVIKSAYIVSIEIGGRGPIRMQFS